MPGIILIGTQWGDEGKGKITDILADDMDLVVRYQGGNNAGHTVVDGEQELKLHLIPSGILNARVIPVIAAGVVVDPGVLLAEIDQLLSKGISTEKLIVSDCAHVIMPYHKLIDAALEDQLGELKIGTTKKGVGPAYTDKFSRSGIRIQELLDPAVFKQKLTRILKIKNEILVKLYGYEPLEAAPILEEYNGYADRLRPYVTDTGAAVNDALEKGQRVLFEGAQGTLLDIDHGTYPFVTSSSPVAGGACAGVGVGPLKIDKVLGIVKAYSTRVGTGPFPTEQDNEIGMTMQERGVEFGTTTGRRRRCGWLDIPILKYAIRVNGINSLVMTKLDVLSRFETVKICVGYRCGDKIYDVFPSDQAVLNDCTPIYEELTGWQEEIVSIRKLEELPKAARDYIDRVVELVGVSFEIISVGPGRKETISLGRI